MAASPSISSSADRARMPAAISDELFRIVPDFGFHSPLQVEVYVR
jgi:hypothetical protein